MKNGLKDALTKTIDELSNAQLWQFLMDARQQKSEAALVEKMCKERLRDELGDQEQLEIIDGEGVYWEYRSSYRVSQHDLEEAVPDEDMRAMILDVKWKKAKSTLPPEIYEALEKAKQPDGKPTRVLKVGKIK